MISDGKTSLTSAILEGRPDIPSPPPPPSPPLDHRLDCMGMGKNGRLVAAGRGRKLCYEVEKLNSNILLGCQCDEHEGAPLPPSAPLARHPGALVAPFGSLVGLAYSH